jgi:hypothetical protein
MAKQILKYGVLQGDFGNLLLFLSDPVTVSYGAVRRTFKVFP